MGGPMPEDLKTHVMRIFYHAKKQIELLEDALNKEEFDTADFLASIAVMDLTELRSRINALLRFTQRQQR
jgi:hypothetical protein